MKNKWDRNDWQGRRKDQIDATNAIIYGTMLLISATIFFAAIKLIGQYFFSK